MQGGMPKRPRKSSFLLLFLQQKEKRGWWGKMQRSK